LTLSVAEGNAPATALYLRHGFGYTGAAGVMNPGGRRELVMAKALDDSDRR
jgi:hypothetical protein